VWNNPPQNEEQQMSGIDYNPDGLTEDQIRINLLQEQATAQTQELSRTIDRLNSMTERKSNLEDQKYRAFEVIKDAIENEDIDPEESWLAEVGKIFLWEFTKEVEVSFTITGTATVNLPYGKELSDYSFSSSDVSIDCDSWTGGVEINVEDHQLEDINEN
jgi:hypothetical protein